jgi:hypothetical protein
MPPRRRTSEPDHRFDHLPERDRPEILVGEVLEEVRTACLNRPRNVQLELGVSDVATPCLRELICRCGGLPEPADGRGSDVNLKAEVGTWMHSGLQTIIDLSPLNRGPDGWRFLTETALYCGSVGGRPLVGNCDLFDVHGAAVWDWKSKSKTQMLEHRRHGLGPRYRTQCQTYGFGWFLLGLPVSTVGCVFLPRDGEWSDIFYLAEPFDPRVAIEAISRADGIAKLVAAIGVDATIAAYGEPVCDDRWCRWCPAPRKFRTATDDPSADPLG